MLHRIRTPRMARGLFICLTLCLLVAPLAGCGRAAPAPEPVEITFRHPESDTKYYESALTKFKELYPYITVKLEKSDSTVADCFVDDSYDVPGLVADERAVNLSPFLDQDQDFEKNDFVPGILDIFTTENKLWAVPAGFNPAVMYYNKDLFDQRGVATPRLDWTLDDFVAAASGVRDADNNIFGYATPQSGDMPDLLMFVYLNGGRILDDLKNPTRATFDDPKTIEAVEWYLKLVNEYNVAPTAEQMRATFGGGGQAVYRGILQNQVAMWIGWFGDRGGQTWPVQWEMQWGMAPLPRGDAAVTMAFAEGYFIAADSAHPEACWKWISYLSRQMPNRLVPSRTSVVESEAYEKFAGREIAETARASVRDVVLISPELAQFENVIQIFYMAVAGVTAGQLTPEEAMIYAQEEWEKQAPE